MRTASGSKNAIRFDLTADFASGEHWSMRANLGSIQAKNEGQFDGQLLVFYRF